MAALWMLMASLLFAAMGVCVKLASAEFHASEIVFYRGFVALVAIGGWMLVSKSSPRTQHARSHLWRSIAGTLSLIASYESIIRIPLAAAVTLGYTSPIFLALLVVFWLKEPVRRHLYLALLLGFCGIVLLLRPTLNADQWFGAMCGLACGALASVAYLNVRLLGQLGEPEWRTVFYFALVNSLVALPWAVSEGSLSHSLPGWGYALGVGVLGLAAQLCMTAAYKRGRTLVTASLSYSTVVFSCVMGMWLWGEMLSLMAWFGVALIIGAGLLASLIQSSPREEVKTAGL